MLTGVWRALNEKLLKFHLIRVFIMKWVCLIFLLIDSNVDILKNHQHEKKQHNKTLDHVLDPAFSFAEKGSLYVWGKNSHVIRPDKPSNAKFWLPFHINKGQRPIQAAFCGAWHAVALTGFPGMVFLVSCWN